MATTDVDSNMDTKPNVSSVILTSSDASENNDSGLKIGSTYKTFADFDRILQQRKASLGETWVVSNGAKTVVDYNSKVRDPKLHLRSDFQYKTVTMRCKHWGSRQSFSATMRVRWSDRTDCRAMFTLLVDKSKDALVMTECNLTHNHLLNTDKFQCQKLTLREENVIKEMVEKGTPVLRVQEFLLKTFNKEVSSKALQRLKSKWTHQKKMAMIKKASIRVTKSVAVQADPDDIHLLTSSASHIFTPKTEGSIRRDKVIPGSLVKSEASYHHDEDDQVADTNHHQADERQTKGASQNVQKSQSSISNASKENQVLSSWYAYNVWQHVQRQDTSLLAQPNNDHQAEFSFLVSAINSVVPNIYSTCGFKKDVHGQLDKLLIKVEQMCLPQIISEYEQFKTGSPRKAKSVGKKRNLSGAGIVQNATDEVRLKRARVALNRVDIPEEGYVNVNQITESEPSGPEELGRGKRRKRVSSRLDFIDGGYSVQVPVNVNKLFEKAMVSKKAGSSSPCPSSQEVKILTATLQASKNVKTTSVCESPVSTDNATLKTKSDFTEGFQDEDFELGNNFKREHTFSANIEAKNTAKDNESPDMEENNGVQNRICDTSEKNLVEEDMDEDDENISAAEEGEDLEHKGDSDMASLKGYALELYGDRGPGERYDFDCDLLAPNMCSECGSVHGTPSEVLRHWKETHSDGENIKNVKKLKCDQCEATFCSAFKFKLHYRIHTDSRPHPCTLCKMTFRTFTPLQKHLLCHRKPEKYSCFACWKMFINEAKFLHHMANHTEEERKYHEQNKDKVIKVDLSSYDKNVTLEDAPRDGETMNGPDYNDKSTIKLQLDGQTTNDMSIDRLVLQGVNKDVYGERRPGERLNFECDKLCPNICSLCQKRFDSPRELRSHWKDQHKTDATNCQEGAVKYFPFGCDVCPQMFATNSRIKMHYRIHTDSRPHTCAICGRGFRLFKTLEDHLPVHRQEKSFSCPTCSKMFVSKYRLQEHEKIHDPNRPRPYICEFCGLGFVTKHHLRCHLMSHSNEKPYVCATCGLKFGHKNSLRLHKRLHTNSHNLMCDICGRNFNVIGHLRTHRRTHTGEKPFKCNQCSYTCASFSQLNDHRSCHRKDKPHACQVPMCNKTFKRHSHVIQHHKTHHPGVKPYKCRTCREAYSLLSHLKHHIRQSDTCKDERVTFKSKKYAEQHFSSADDYPSFAVQHTGDGEWSASQGADAGLIHQVKVEKSGDTLEGATTFTLEHTGVAESNWPATQAEGAVEKSEIILEGSALEACHEDEVKQEMEQHLIVVTSQAGTSADVQQTISELSNEDLLQLQGQTQQITVDAGALSVDNPNVITQNLEVDGLMSQNLTEESIVIHIVTEPGADDSGTLHLSQEEMDRIVSLLNK